MGQFARDYFGTIIEVGDIVIYPASGMMMEAAVIEVRENSVQTLSSNGTKKWKKSRYIFSKKKTLNALKEMYPEDHI